MLLKFKIFRYDPKKDEKPYYQAYEIQANPADRILDCLNRIRWEQDPTLSFRMSCGHGVCGSDGMRINGTSALACQKLVKDFKENEEILIEPLQVFRVVRDLVVDQVPFFEKYNSVKPYLITNSPPPDKERLQSIEEHKIFEDAIRCILCACCTSSCPINQAKETETYIGPAALVRAFRYLFDSRDEGAVERISLLDNKDGAWGCQTRWWCTKVCPKEIPVTKQIAQIKKRIIESKKGKQ
ncbi:succinate dehydrogenase and fumarate reductase iron-sulfur protein [Candidatus Methanoperedens nitroreducens]|uniref:succinate dehydrogenase n=1 Tax=Candidatus Methanoperedens nitratireducens TaxID=1392998 RepID=A0A062V2F3_9EURY|nr:succinate dehydrogenase iron-sulfur subunit [Candidatus Methanoperedens nitroreducens]KCZ71547.1 succinate dehydrogenase and fumarate reductase iron-sulfur protein [Candidatus Methanoperedens nitroreducens]MDJ1421174.1 succinate dehydrogenase iron-sulfur subunit [Candidatus Methanoperedens sp.]